MSKGVKHNKGLDDRQLCRRARLGSLSAFDQLIERHQRPLLTLLSLLAPDETIAREWAADVLTAAYPSLGQLGRRESFGLWLQRLTVQIVAGRMSGLARPAIPEKAGTAAWFQQLEWDHRTILILRELNGVGELEAAWILGISPGTARTRLHQARMKFRALLRKADLL